MIKVEIFKYGRNTWLRTLEELHFSLKGHEFTIPAGFECDGARIPRFFWRLIGPPMDCHYVEEAIRHDWLYRYQPVSRSVADEAFFVWLNEKGLHIRRYLIYIAVRLFGWIAWLKNQKKGKNKMKNSLLTLTALTALILTGCNSVSKQITAAASGKNLALDGYVMYGTVESAATDTGTPAGKLIIGRLTYKSRKVGIPVDQKVPTTGNFKSTKTKSLFGTEEHIIEYDFTAGSDADAAAARQALEAKVQQALEAASNSK